MDLRVNQFKVRYQGHDYGPGEVICGVSGDTAKALITGSNGTIEALPERQATVATKAESDIKTEDEKQIGGKSKATNEAILPTVDPAKTVK